MTQLAADFEQLLRSSLIGVVRAGGDGSVRDANDAFLASVGRSRAELGGLRWATLVSPEQAAHHEESVARLTSGGRTPPWESELLAADGTRVPVLMGGTLLEGPGGDWVGFVLDLRHRERRRAVHVTPQPSDSEGRTVVMDRAGILGFLDQELSRAKRTGAPLAVILAALDGFEGIRKSMGEVASQELFWAAVDRTKLGLRGYDGMGRFGPGDFVLVLPECDMGGVLAVARRMQAAVAREPFHAGEVPVALTMSAGAISSEDRGGCTAAELLQAVDAALVRARSRGGSRVELVTS